MLNNQAPLNKSHDYYGEAGAQALATRIRKFWSLRGKDVEVWVEPIIHHASPTANPAPAFTVKSNISLGSVQ